MISDEHGEGHHMVETILGFVEKVSSSRFRETDEVGMPEKSCFSSDARVQNTQGGRGCNGKPGRVC